MSLPQLHTNTLAFWARLTTPLVLGQGPTVGSSRGTMIRDSAVGNVRYHGECRSPEDGLKSEGRAHLQVRSPQG
jgi:hypothetical protein